MHRLPVVAIVGRPNVGKSTLFNRLTRSRRAVVDDTPGVTRDRLYGTSDAFGRPFRLVDTGGLDAAFGEDIEAAAQLQTQIAIEEADIILFLVDGQAGPTAVDHEVAERLRRGGKPVILVANKLESVRRGAVEDFYELRLGEALPVSALHGTQVGDLVERLHDLLPDAPDDDDDESEDAALAIAVVGRPNVGKSSLVNGILGEERQIVSDRPGTTRDAIDTPFEKDGQEFVLVDTAGIRRKAKVHQALEYYCVLRAIEAIERCHVAILVLDARDGLTDQDKRIAGMAHEAGRGLVLAVNKWDLLTAWVRDREGEIEVAEDLAIRLHRATPKSIARDYARAVRLDVPFCAYAPIIYTVATRREGVAKVLAETVTVAEHHAFRVPTAQLNELLRQTLDRHPPPTRKGRRLKVFYATQARVRPPTFVVFVNDPQLVHFSFERFLENRLREEFNFEGTPIRLIWRARREDEAPKPTRRRVRRGEG